MSNLPDFLAPVAPPTTSDRPAPKPTDSARRSVADDSPRFADELDRERASERADARDRAAERAADRNRAAEQATDRDRAAARAADQDRAAEQASDRDRAAERAADQDRAAEQADGHNRASDGERKTDNEPTAEPASKEVQGTETHDETEPDPVQSSTPSAPVIAKPAAEPTPEIAVEAPVVAPQTPEIPAEKPTQTPLDALLENAADTPTDSEVVSQPAPEVIDPVVTASKEPTPDIPLGEPAAIPDEPVTSAPVVAPAPTDMSTQTTEVIKVTALSGETVPLTPPPAPINDPGALGRWFAQAAGPISLESPTAQSAGLLNTLATQTSQQALNSGQHRSQDGDLAAIGRNVTQPAATTPEMTFADAMATSSMDSDSLDALVTQAINRANAALEPGTQTVPTVTTGQTVATGAQTAMTTVPQAATGQAVPVTALAVEITRQAANGKTQFDIRLDPPELGRLNVRLEMDASGQTRTHLVVERAETLDMLATDARSLERALQQAGLKSEPGSISFELAQDTADGFDQGGQSASANDQNDGQSAGTDGTTSGEPADNPIEAITSPEAIRHQIAVTGHLDVHV